MIRAYDEYGNIIDLVELENKIRSKAIDDFVKLVEKYDWNIRNRNENPFIYGAIGKIAEQLKVGESE